MLTILNLSSVLLRHLYKVFSLQADKNTNICVFSHLWAPLTFPRQTAEEFGKETTDDSDGGQETRETPNSQQMKSTKTYLPDSNVSSSDRRKNKCRDLETKQQRRAVSLCIKEAISDRWSFTCFNTFVIDGHQVLLCGWKIKSSICDINHLILKINLTKLCAFGYNRKSLLTFLHSAHFS